MKYCRKCGKELADNVRFCTNCGYKFEEPQVPSTNVGGNGYNQPQAPMNNDNGSNKKTIAIMATVLGVVVVVCAVVLIVFMMKSNNNDNSVTTRQEESTIEMLTTASSNDADEGRFESLKKRFNAAKLKAASKGIKVKKEKNAAMEALDQYEGAIDDNDTSVLSEYGDEAEKYVSKLESAANKSKKKKHKKSGTIHVIRDSVPESDKVSYRVAPTEYVGEYYFDDYLDDDEDRYAATSLAINEYFARKGCCFKTPALQKYFNHQSWYTNEGRDTSTVSFSGTEKHNVSRLYKDRKWYKENLWGASGEAKDFSYSEFMDVARKLN